VTFSLPSLTLYYPFPPLSTKNQITLKKEEALSKIAVVFAKEIKSSSVQSCGQCNCLHKKGRRENQLMD
jgi:hypothetical protein